MIAFLTLGLMWALGGPVHAQGPEADAEARARAKAAYESAQAEYNLGHFQKALEFYELAYKNVSRPALLFNIAQCHRQLGDMRSAATTYRAFLRTADTSDAARARASALLAEVEQALQKQQEAQAAKPLGTSPDGKEPSDAPPVAAATVVPGAPNGVEVASTAGRPGAPGAAVEAAVPAAPSKPRVYTWVAAGAAGVALLGGTYFGLKSKSTASDLTSQPHDAATIDSKLPSVKSDANKANALFLAGGLLAAGAGALFLLEF
jgi:tetratricopeptide (TPR) repeat protein